MTNETTKPVVTQAAEWEFFRDSAYYDMWCVRMKSTRGFQDGFHLVNGDEAGALCALLNHRLAHSPSEPSVVSQDLVPVAVDDLARQVASYVDVGTRERTNVFNAARSAIEAAQIAARNDALEEAAKVIPEVCHGRSEWDEGHDACARSCAAAIRTLRTPSQHQEEQ